MLPKNTFKKLKDFLKKHNAPWLRENKPLLQMAKKAKLPEDIKRVNQYDRTVVRINCKLKTESQLDDFLSNKQKFAHILMDAIGDFDRKKKKSHEYVEIYRKALVSKQVFSNVFNNKLPSKDTVIMFAFALELTLQEAEELLKRAGFFLGDCVKRDMIFRYCFENRIFDIREVNELLEQEKERLLVKDYRKNKTGQL